MKGNGLMFRSWLRAPHGGLLVIGLFVVGIVLLFTSVSGVFIVDEEHHLAAVRALSSGRLTVEDFDGLSYSPEIAFFDPASRHRAPGSTTTTVPPLYPILALPFYPMGWSGLVALNILSFLACAWMVFFYARKYANQASTPWLALATFGLASYSIEYAQAVWPHMLAVALCTGGFLLASRVREGGPIYLALVAGLLTGLATGVRYQNIIFAGAVGLGLVIWARKRILSGSLYLLGVAGPLLVSSLLNHARYGFWNPVSKGAHYISVGAGTTMKSTAFEALAVLWTRVVDFSTHPPIGETLQQTELLMHPEPHTGAFLLLGTAVKKAWLQSSPWILVALFALLLAWRLSVRANFENREPNTRSRELRSIFLITGCILGLFAMAGYMRVDGLCFNQRYFLELMPLVAVTLAWALEGCKLGVRPVLAGCLAGAILAAGPLMIWEPSQGIRQLLLMKIPVLLAGLILVSWFLARRGRWPAFLPVMLGACLSWSVVIHFGEDLATSRSVRHWRARQHDAVARVLPRPPEKAAVFAYWGYKDGLGPLQLEYDLIIADPWIDRGESASRLTGQLLSAGRRVFVLAEGMPKYIFDSISRGRRYRMVTQDPYSILEVAVKEDAQP